MAELDRENKNRPNLVEKDLLQMHQLSFHRTSRHFIGPSSFHNT